MKDWASGFHSSFIPIYSLTDMSPAHGKKEPLSIEVKLVKACSFHQIVQVVSIESAATISAKISLRPGLTPVRIHLDRPKDSALQNGPQPRVSLIPKAAYSTWSQDPMYFVKEG